MDKTGPSGNNFKIKGRCIILEKGLKEWQQILLSTVVNREGRFIFGAKILVGIDLKIGVADRHTQS